MKRVDVVPGRRDPRCAARVDWTGLDTRCRVATAIDVTTEQQPTALFPRQRVLNICGGWS